ncbi:hypothetical protein [Pseudomonas viridiflava]|uniref:hypothetical protein n=1 Tax=Pseudomonas viridiflava TaxID=33069 RepID=UPI001C31DC2A|nr:hypothetical protein [Pseudomonas viridiflava]MEE3926386.1 hypothetical protein [Pseudomonas viridiflava]MEE3932779.1 hypothetical protein [Pseudomonas viridiflava]MEE3939705.1 hypothetical protein [Pseudomonas viridiflava]MEE3969358.1 hypothetical protein [Pseudomonas viridiflava]MEE3983757.1 hypothetical protein [Pseudomonas viridiflava]
MTSKLTFQEIAERTGLTVDQVGAYYADSEQRPDGAWTIYFDPKIPKDLLDGLKGFYALDLPAR